MGDFIEELTVPAIEVTQSQFNETITANPFVVVDFWAPWCGPCRAFAPIYDQMADKHTDIVFAKVNTEQEQALAGAFQIRSIPTLMIFREQIIVYAQPGSLPASALEELLAQARALDMDEVRAELAKEEAAAPRAGG